MPPLLSFMQQVWGLAMHFLSWRLVFEFDSPNSGPRTSSIKNQADKPFISCFCLDQYHVDRFERAYTVNLDRKNCANLSLYKMVFCFKIV